MASRFLVHTLYTVSTYYYYQLAKLHNLLNYWCARRDLNPQPSDPKTLLVLLILRVIRNNRQRRYPYG